MQKAAAAVGFLYFHPMRSLASLFRCGGKKEGL